MNRRFAMVLIFAFVVAGAATLLFYRLVASRLSMAPKPTTVQVFVAARNLEVGTLLKETDVTTAEWPSAVPPNAILKKEDIAGRGVIAAIYQGEPIVETRLAPKGAGAGLAATIPTGMRAVALRVNEIIGVSGFVVPGQRVDVIISGIPPNATGSGTGPLSRTILQNVQVLSAGTNIQKDAEGKPVQVPVVNVLVKPEDAEILTLANSDTRVQLVLRNPLDTETAKTPGSALVNLFSGKTAPPASGQRANPRMAPVRPFPIPVAPVVKEKPPVIVEVIQNGQRAETKFKVDPED